MTMEFAAATAAPAVWQPQAVREAYLLKRRWGSGGTYVSGGTLLRTRWEPGLERMPSHLIHLGAVRGIAGVKPMPDRLAVGSQTTLAACGSEPLLRESFPLLAEAARAIASPSVRQLATLGGNVMSAIGDALPALLLYDAELVWFGKDGYRTEPLAAWLKRRSVQAEDPHELLAHIHLPCAAAARHSEDSPPAQQAGRRPKRFAAYRKVGRREAFTPSVVTVAVSGELAADGRYYGVRLAAGGGQTRPDRFGRLEQWLEGRPAESGTLAALHERLMEQFEPQPDAFADAAYRKRTAAHLITAMLWQAALPAGEEEAACS